MSEDFNWAEFAKQEGIGGVKKTTRKGERITVDPSKKFMVDAEGFIFRQIPSFPFYYISEEQEMRNQRGERLIQHINMGTNIVQLRILGENVKMPRWRLLHDAWPEHAPKRFGRNRYFIYHGEPWRPIESFPRYAISLSGKVIYLDRWSMCTINARGMVYLSSQQKQYGRNIHRLYRETFHHELGQLSWFPDTPTLVFDHQERAFNLAHMREIEEK